MFLKISIKKFFICLLVFSMIIASTVPSLAASAVNMPYVIHETKDSRYIGSGIQYENIRKFTTKGWWNINVVRVDLTDEYAEISGLFSDNGLSNRDTVSDMVTDSKAVAGINGDFFTYSPIPHSMGSFIQDGEVISSPIERAYALPTFYLDTDNNSDITFFDRKMNITSLNSNKSVTISLINKAADMDMVTLLNKHWGSKSFGKKYNNGPDDQMVEMVVVDNVVQDIRIGEEAVPIPENGYIISVRGERKEPLLDNFEEGDEVKLDVGTSPNLEDIKFAIGGGSIILQDGNITNTNIDIKGDQPRTGMGISEDGKELIIATIDGRDTSYKGVSQKIFGSILRDLGAYDAINLDGGGSTTMAIRPIDKQLAEVVNKPSEGTERKVVNGVGVFTNAPKGELSYIEIDTDETDMFPNTTRKFSIKGYDQYHNPLKIDNSQVEYTFEGVDGEIYENIFEAKSSGTVTVQANYKGLTDSIDLKVLGEVKSIDIPVDKFHLHPNGSKNIGTIYGKDQNGYSAKIYKEDIEWTVLGNIGNIEDGVFYSNGNIGAGAISLSIGDALNNILVSIGSDNKTSIEGFENIENFKSVAYPDYVSGSISTKPEAKEGQNSIGLKYDFAKGEDTRASYLMFKPEGKNGLALKGTPNRLSLWVKGDGNGTWLRGKVLDANGNSHYINFEKSLDSTQWQQVEANIPDNISYPIALERIYVVETDSSKSYSGEILIDGLEAYYPPSYDETIAPTPTEFKDNRNVEANVKDGFSLMVTRIPKTSNTTEELDKTLVSTIYDKIRNRANQHDVSMLIGKANNELNNGIKSDKIINIGAPYTSHRYKNVFMIDASSAKGGIRPTNPQQWVWLKNGLANAEEDHIMLFLNTPIFGAGGFVDKLEAELLHETLVQTSESGKSVWVIHPGNTTKTELKDGVRYIQLNDKIIDSQEDMKYLDTVEFSIDGDNITYQVD